MYQPDKSKIKSFYNQFTNPTGKAPMPTNLGGFFGSKPTSIKDFFGGMKSPEVSNPNAKFDLKNIPVAPMTPYQPSAPIQSASAAAPVALSGAIFSQPASSSVAPIAAPTTSSNIPSQYLKEDGTQMTPEEYVAKVKGEMKARVGQ